MLSMRIVDNKKVHMSDDEYQMYKDICASYDNPPTQKGTDLFCDLFETDDDGVIIFLKPPSKRQTSFEIFLFLMSVMQNQHLRLMRKQVDDLVAQVNIRMGEVEGKLNNIHLDRMMKKHLGQ